VRRSSESVLSLLKESIVRRRLARPFIQTLVVLSVFASSAGAQSIGSQLSALLTEQRAQSDFVPDIEAANQTFATVAGLFGVELATLPVASSSGGFVYRLNRDLGLVERASDGFGPFFTERVLRNSRGQVSVGITYQFARFSSLQGADLREGTFPTNAARLSGSVQPFSVDTLELELESRTTTAFASYGVSDRLAVGVALPISTIRFSGQRNRSVNGLTALQSSQAGAATGLGDMAVNTRYMVVGSSLRGASIGADLRLPTGRSEDLLGAGEATGRFLSIGTWEEGHLAVNVNGGFGIGGLSREVFWGAGTTLAPTPRVTIVGEVMGRWLAELSRVSDVYQPHPLLPGVETMRWLSLDPGIHTTFMVTGAKWNVGGSWLLNTNLLFRVTDAGLRARVTPSISIDYAFER
jgi:hypothetical protein